MNLADYLAAAHSFSVHGGTDPAPAAAHAKLSRVEIEAERAELQVVSTRSHVARVQVAFLDRVLRLMG